MFFLSLYEIICPGELLQSALCEPRGLSIKVLDINSQARWVSDELVLLSLAKVTVLT